MSTATHYRDMNAAQRLAWGQAESAARQADLTDKTAAGLERAQANAKARRRLIGASTRQATAMVIEANRLARIAAAHAARATAEVQP